MQPHELSRTISTLNSRKKIRCVVTRPCKRMDCFNCRQKRREFFVNAGLAFAKEKKLDLHLVISWRETTYQDSWLRLAERSRILSKSLSSLKIGAYIRVLCVDEIGYERFPHMHYLINHQSVEKFEKVYVKKLKRPRSSMFVTDAYEIEGLLGYFFDQNFLPAHRDLERIKGTRIISASRPMRCCFPTYQLEKQLHDLTFSIDDGKKAV